jgi:hypothetical protein
VLSTKDTYKCPGDTAQDCQRGGAYSATAAEQKLKSTTAEAAAKEDISKNATESYGKGYGTITSHTELASKAVTVAGEKGYLVRWKVVTSKGDDGYVESLVFPSPADSKSLIVVRFGIDISSKAPKESVIDQGAQGVRDRRHHQGHQGGVRPERQRAERLGPVRRIIPETRGPGPRSPGHECGRVGRPSAQEEPHPAGGVRRPRPHGAAPAGRRPVIPRTAT